MKHIHRGWFILFITVLNSLACLGFGRFSLGAIIPFMKEGLALSYSETGVIASSVFFGYLLTAVSSGYLVIRFSSKKVILLSLFITTVGMLGSALASGFLSAYISCFLIGMGAGGGNVVSVGLVGRWFAPEKRGMALGVTNSGSGIGMVLSGLVVPFIVTLNPSEGWRISWFILMLATFFIIIINWFFLKNTPAEIGLEPVGQAMKKAGVIKTKIVEKQLIGKDKNLYKSKVVWLIGIIYLAWGFSYLIFSTFFVDYLMKDANLEKDIAGQFFAVAGMASIMSGFIWGATSDRLGRIPTLFIICLLQSSILVAFSISRDSDILLLETIIYALTLWGVPTVIVAAISDLIQAEKTPVAISFITLFFGVGQFISPIITGYLIDSTNSYFSAFILSAAICFLGSLGCVLLYFYQKKQRTRSLMEHSIINEKI